MKSHSNFSERPKRQVSTSLRVSPRLQFSPAAKTSTPDAKRARTFSAALPSLEERRSWETYDEPSPGKPWHTGPIVRTSLVDANLSCKSRNARANISHETQRVLTSMASNTRRPPADCKDHESTKLDDIDEMLRDKIKLSPEIEPPIEPLIRVRSSSSTYDAQDSVMSRVQSPDTPVLCPTIRVADFSKYGQANDSLSNIHSSSSASEVTFGGNPCEPLKDAADAILEWQGEICSDSPQYNAFSHAEISEVLPSDSLSGSISFGMFRPLEVKKRHVMEKEPSVRFQYDGGNDHRNADSPSIPPHFGPRAAKRKAPHFSLRSISSQIAAKRPRLGLRKMASTAYEKGSRQLSQVRRRLVEQSKSERKDFAAWRATQRRSRPADPLMGKPEKGLASFALDRGLHSHEDWWQDGVRLYQAPPWLHFGDK